MTTFDKREDAFERKFVQDREVEFTLQARKVKLLAHWAAKKMQYDEKRTVQYAEELICQQVDGRNSEEIIECIMRDFARAGVALTEEDVRQQLSVYEEQVRQALDL